MPPTIKSRRNAPDRIDLAIALGMISIGLMISLLGFGNPGVALY